MNYSSSKPNNCPECNSTEVATIVYGYPARRFPFSEKDMNFLKNFNKSTGYSSQFVNDYFEDEQNAELTVLGGCCVDENSAIWQCTSCKVEIFKKKSRMTQVIL